VVATTAPGSKSRAVVESCQDPAVVAERTATVPGEKSIGRFTWPMLMPPTRSGIAVDPVVGDFPGYVPRVHEDATSALELLVIRF